MRRKGSQEVTRNKKGILFYGNDGEQLVLLILGPGEWLQLVCTHIYYR